MSSGARTWCRAPESHTTSHANASWRACSPRCPVDVRTVSMNAESQLNSRPRDLESRTAAARRYQDLSRFRLPDDFRGRNAVAVQLWWLVSATLFRWSPQIAYGWRRWLLRLFGAHIGKKVLIRPSVRVTYPWKVSVGDYSWIGDDVVLYSLGHIDIGAHAVVSQGSYLCAGTHDSKDLSFAIDASPIHIADEAWVASHVFIMPGVSIGEGTVVSARSLVSTDLPEGMICAGSPARVLRPRCSDQKGGYRP